MDQGLRTLSERPDVTTAATFLRDRDEATVALQIRITEIPAPPFQERRRGAAVAGLLEAAGLSDVAVDAVGNVVAKRAGADEGPPLVVSAHLDTVFPPETDLTVRREGDVLYGPGISDDGRGLACLVALARAMAAADLRTSAPLLFVATVGEEGAGDLRGVKELFGPTGAARQARGFISLDGAGMERIVTEGLGSRRFRVTIFGPGGHSWTDWGTPNPAHALAELASRMAGLKLEREPKTTLTVARLGGGKSINAIPQEAWMEIDARSTSQGRLEALAGEIRGAVTEAQQKEEDLEFQIDVIGDRPGGRTDENSELVQAAMAATRLLGYEPCTTISSTDANIPMTRNIPAITLGGGGDAGKAHTTDEWYRNEGGPDGIVRALYTLLAAAGVADG
ncbi:MAG: M20/M25/M40 family metallo-hydrolase [Longimicrobiales bacterium]|nr:M20/M25/M40 family metallo-hydrolase [Longimicrobiales bacterium]